MDTADERQNPSLSFHYLFPIKNLSDQTWPWRKIGQGQPSVIIWANLVVFVYIKLHIKIQCHWLTGSEEDFLKIFTVYGHGGHVGGPRPLEQVFIPEGPGGCIWNLAQWFQRRSHLKLGSDDHGWWWNLSYKLHQSLRLLPSTPTPLHPASHSYIAYHPLTLPSPPTSHSQYIAYLPSFHAGELKTVTWISSTYYWFPGEINNTFICWWIMKEVFDETIDVRCHLQCHHLKLILKHNTSILYSLANKVQ